MMFNAGVIHVARLEANFPGGYCLFDKDYLFFGAAAFKSDKFGNTTRDVVE
jgi:hypothetical protein